MKRLRQILVVCWPEKNESVLAIGKSWIHTEYGGFSIISLKVMTGLYHVELSYNIIISPVFMPSECVNKMY